MLFQSLREWLTSLRGQRRDRRPATCRLAVERLEHRLAPAGFSVVMEGLDHPRGLAFGPDGALYVAEAGEGGTDGSFEVRPGVTASYGRTGSVSRLLGGRQDRVVTGLSSYIAPDGATGPHDIAFDVAGNAFVTVGFGGNPLLRDQLGAVGAGFGQLVQLLPDGGWQPVADLGQYEALANPQPFAIDSNPYGLLAGPGGRVVTDAGGNSLLRVADDGGITTLAVFPSRLDRPTDSVPTSVAVGPDGAYYVGELTGVPFAAGAANIYRVAPGQAPQVVHTGFKTIIDLDFGPDGSLYVLQHATGPMFFAGPGALFRIAPDGTRTEIKLDGLTLTRPTSVLVGDDGAIYVSNFGISKDTGEVIRITLGPAEVEGVVVNDGSAQRSMVKSLTVTFDRRVTLEDGAFELRRQGGALVGLDVAASVVGGKTLAVLTFAGPGIVGGSLADGNYTLTIRGDLVRDGDGTALDGDADGTAGGDRADAFFRLFGDSDGDRDVDVCDLIRYLGSFGRRAGDPHYLGYFDFNGDGRVGLLDLLAFAHRVGSRLQP